MNAGVLASVTNSTAPTSQATSTLYGTGIGGLTTLEEQVLVNENKGPRRVSPFMVPMLMANAAVTQIAMRHNLLGPTSSVSTACATNG